MSTSPNQVFLLLTNKSSPALAESFNALYNQTKDLAPCKVLYHQSGSSTPPGLNHDDMYCFSNNILTALNYIPIMFSLTPGSNHFPLLAYYLKNPDYDYYWCIEDDVRFTGDWKIFFNSFNIDDSDFISSHIQIYHENPDWFWWSMLANPFKVIPLEKRVKSFNPIYRISRAALELIHFSLSEKWCGHHELLFATLIHEAGLKIADFGGEGRFVLPGNENRFYTGATTDDMRESSMRWRPAFETKGQLKDKLYHPVKL